MTAGRLFHEKKNGPRLHKLVLEKKTKKPSSCQNRKIYPKLDHDCKKQIQFQEIAKHEPLTIKIHKRGLTCNTVSVRDLSAIFPIKKK